MQVRALLTDDGAVSPVIGVILMVAITVILAAVIASFALGLGGTQDATPTVKFSTEYTPLDSDAGNLTITHESGSAVRVDELYVRGDNGSDGGTYVSRYNDPWSNFTTTVQDNAAAAGDPNPVYGSGGSGTTMAVGTNSSEDTDSDVAAVSSGDYIRFPVGSDAEIRIIYVPKDSGSTTTLTEFVGPGA